MMKTIIQIILIAVLTYIVLLFLPWWCLFFAAGLVGLLVPNNGLATFLAGFFGVALLWFGQTYIIDMANEGILSAKISELFGLSSSILLMLITAMVGGLSGGFGALTGKFLGGLFKKKKESYTVYT